MRFAIYTNAYFRALRANDPLATFHALAMRKLTVEPEILVPSQPWRDVRQFERMHGHVYVDSLVMRLMNNGEETQEGTYSSTVADTWTERLLAATAGKELQYPVFLGTPSHANTDGYYVVRNSDGDTVCVYAYLIDALRGIYLNGWNFWVRDFDYN